MPLKTARVARAKRSGFTMFGRGQRFPTEWNFFKGGAFALNDVIPEPAAGDRPLKTYIAVSMSEKTKRDEALSAPATGGPDQVPDWLGNRLRRMFDDVMDEPVPDEFKALLKQLEDKERGS
jgi:hypothetical protein